MGFDTTTARFHCHLKSQGVKFTNTAMLGRQNYHGLTPSNLIRAVFRAGATLSRSEAESILNAGGGYAESFYRWLGAETIDSFDYSDYEGATQLWDMNEPLEEHHRGKYDFVFDGGTLEHVFRYPEALRQALTLLKPGGVFLSATPANSYLGHGFYQFSPDLPYSILRPENGMECGEVFLIEMRNNAKFYEVVPPAEARGRALASTPWPALMYFWGRRADEIPPRLAAFQPDYENAWDKGSHVERPKDAAGFRLRSILDVFPHEMKNDILRSLKLAYVALGRNSFFERNWFKYRKDI